MATADLVAFSAVRTVELGAGVWQDTELPLWKPVVVWFSVKAFHAVAGLRDGGVNGERPTV